MTCPLRGVPVAECAHCGAFTDPAATMGAVRREALLGGLRVNYGGATCPGCDGPLRVGQRAVALDHEAGVWAHPYCAGQLDAA